MGSAVKRKKCWLLRVELAVFICLACFCVVKKVIVDVGSANAGYLGKIHRLSLDNAPTVTAILYNQDNPSVILGDRTIAHEADVIDGATLVKIHKDKIEFEKEGHRWTQKIGERVKSPQ